MHRFFGGWGGGGYQNLMKSTTLNKNIRNKKLINA